MFTQSKRGIKKNFIKTENINYELFILLFNELKYFKTNLAITRAGSSILAELLNCRLPFNGTSKTLS